MMRFLHRLIGSWGRATTARGPEAVPRRLPCVECLEDRNLLDASSLLLRPPRGPRSDSAATAGAVDLPMIRSGAIGVALRNAWFSPNASGRLTAAFLLGAGGPAPRAPVASWSCPTSTAMVCRIWRSTPATASVWPSVSPTAPSASPSPCSARPTPANPARSSPATSTAMASPTSRRQPRRQERREGFAALRRWRRHFPPGARLLAVQPGRSRHPPPRSRRSGTDQRRLLEPPEPGPARVAWPAAARRAHDP
jgi:hypothetical protein